MEKEWKEENIPIGDNIGSDEHCIYDILFFVDVLKLIMYVITSTTFASDSSRDPFPEQRLSKHSLLTLNRLSKSVKILISPRV